MSQRPRVTFYYDVVSPWTRIALEIIKRYQPVWNLDIVYRPVIIAQLFSFAGIKAPILTPVRGPFTWTQDLVRTSEYYSVTIRRPPNFPFNTTLPQLFLRHLSDHPSADQRARHVPAMEACFARIWTQNLPLSTPDDIFDCLHPLWKDGEHEALRQMIAASGTKEMKEHFRSEIKVLVEKGGAFGLPWIVVEIDGHSSSWWGSDRFEQIAAYLGVEWKGPYPDGRRQKISRL
ncbi:hypothetical protein OC861_001851 [Tilletia horrida]|nr:hypothetical protein OC861_001851 [Tilletia horrida]